MCKKEIHELYKNKYECCGCGVCALICPLHKNGNIGAIEMWADEEGFMYPRIEKEKCIKCYRCIEVCPLK